MQKLLQKAEKETDQPNLYYKSQIIAIKTCNITHNAPDKGQIVDNGEKQKGGREGEKS